MTASKPGFKEQVFSGVQPTGNLHLGNYLGAIVRFVEMQKTHECIYCVVDMHAITVWQEPKELRRAIHEVTARTPPSDTRTNSRPSDVAIERASDVLPTPGGPAKQRIGPFTPGFSLRTARYSRMRSFAFSSPE